MVIKKRNLWIFIIATWAVFIYFFFFFPQRRYYFKNTSLLQDSLTARPNNSLQSISSLIPSNAINIRFSYRTNRVKNVTITLDASNINWSDYIGFVQSQLKNYTSSPSSIKGSDKHIVFWGDFDSYFKQIDIALNENFITIQSF